MIRPLRLVGAAVLLVGVVCQFVQRTDPAPPLSYFTIWSAMLGCLVLTAGAAARLPHVWLRGVAATGCVVSGLIFAAVIAPATPSGTWFQPHDDAWVRTANVLLHGVGPVLIAADLIMTPARMERAWRLACSWCAFPAAYLVTIFILQAVGASTIPYPFLDPAETATLPIAGSVAALTAMFLLVGRLLIEAHRLAGKPSGAT